MTRSTQPADHTYLSTESVYSLESDPNKVPTQNVLAFDVVEIWRICVEKQNVHYRPGPSMTSLGPGDSGQSSSAISESVIR